MTAPNPPPRGGAEPRVSDAVLADHIAHGDSDYGQELALDLRDARAEIAELRTKLEAAEAETSRMLHRHIEFDGIRGEQLDKMFIRAKKAEERADAAEAALREMTEQRDGAWEAGRDAAVALCQRKAAMSEAAIPGAEDEDERTRWFARYGAYSSLAQEARALAPPTETAAKKERT